jgi:enoyl-[acyl-carrier protein] reductase II
MLASMILGAEGVQMGTRFVASVEASSHSSFKEMVVKSKEGDTRLMMKSVTPVRLLINKFARDVAAAESRGVSVDEMKVLLGRGRSKEGMFFGKLDEGELEIGQICSEVKNIVPAKEIVDTVWKEFQAALQDPLNHNYNY